MTINVKIFLAAGLFLTACQHPGNTSKTPKADSPIHKTVRGEVPYKVLEHYFLKNTATGQAVPAKITSKEVFEKLFGAAATMKGRPTPVHFEQEYVVAVVKQETDTATLLIPVSLQRSSSGDMTFSYINRRADRQSFSIRPILLIAVDRTEQGNIRLKEH